MEKTPVVLAPDEELAPLVWWKARSTYFIAFGLVGAVIRLLAAFGYTPLGIADFDSEGATNATLEIVTTVSLFLGYRERLNPKRKIAFAPVAK